MGIRKKALAILLTICMIFPLLPGGLDSPFVLEATALSGNGTSNLPFLIGSAADFKDAMANQNAAGKYFKQTADFALNTYDGIVKSFLGNYNGDGHTITISGKDVSLRTDGSGVFGGAFVAVAAGATVENLRVSVDVNFYGRPSYSMTYMGGNDYFGAIAGRNYGTIKNCEAAGTIVMRQLVGNQLWDDKSGTYTDAMYVSMSSLKCFTMVGGIAGGVASGGKIQGCYSSASIYMGTDSSTISFNLKWIRGGSIDKTKTCIPTYILYAGGIVGEINAGTVESCLAEGVSVYMGSGNNSVTDHNMYTYAVAGALAGLAVSGTPTVKNNVVRGGNIYATLTTIVNQNLGAAARLIGQLNGAGAANITRNYWDGNTKTYGVKKDAGMFSYAGYPSEGISKLTSADTSTSLQQNGNPAVSQLDSTYWVTNVVKGDASPTTVPSSLNNTLKCRTVSAPSVSTATVAADSFKFEITPPSGTSADDIRYRLTVRQESGTFALSAGTPGVTDGNSEALSVGTPGVTNGNAETAPLAGGTRAAITKVYTNSDNIHTVAGGKMTLNSPVGFQVELGSSTELKVWMNAPRAILYTRSVGVPGATAKPIISPDINGSLIDGITITMPAAQSTADIAYVISGAGNPADTALVTGGGFTGGLITQKGPINIPWSTIKGTFTGEKLWIRAVAKYGTSNAISEITDMEYTVHNKPAADPPGMSIKSQPFSKTTYYEQGDTVQFSHSDLSGGEIWFTTDGSTPDKTANIGAKYDPAAPYTLPADGRNSVQIKAYLWREHFPPSEILFETVNMKSKHGTPIYSIVNNARIPTGKTLSFLPNPSDLPESIRPGYYMKDGDDAIYSAEMVQNNPGDYYGVLEVNYSEYSTFRYADYANDIPTLSYTIDGNTRSYSFPTPEIRYMQDGAEVTEVRKKRVDGSRIELSGDAGKQISVTARLKATNTAIYTDGAEITQSFAFYTAVATPKAAPGTADDNLTSMSTGQTLSLSCATSGAQIFYSLTGTPLIMLDADDRYVPAKFDAATRTYVEDTGAGQSTFAYDTTKGIPVSGTPGSYFVVYTGAVQDGMSPSEIGVYTYRVANLNAVAAPTATPDTKVNNVTAIENGSSVVLVSATSGARIFYSTEGIPNVSYDSQTKVYTPAAGTKDYNNVRTTGIQVTGTPGSVCTVYAVAMKDGMSDSEVVTLTYKIADLPMVSPPTATPQTSEGNVTTLSLGTKISLTCATSGAKIYYATTGLPALVNGVPTAETKEYKATEGIAVEGNPGSFYSLSAIAVKDNMINSGIVTFTYKIADLPIAEAPTATPKTADGSPATLQSGSVVTLQTGTSEAQIFYSLTGTPVVNKSGAAYSAGPDTLRFDKSIAVRGSAGEFFVIRAVAVKDGWQQSEIATFTYQLPAEVQAVYAAPGEGTVAKGTEVTLATTTHGATIFYEVASKENDLKDPVAYESQVYSKPIKIEADTYISAMAVKDGVESAIMEYEYKLATQVKAPVPSIPSGSVVAKGTRVIFSTDDGASITYTKDGSDPTDPANNKRMYGSEVAIDAEEGKSVSISLYATKTGMTPSEVVSVSYTVSKAEDVMTANPPANSTVKPGDRITLSTSVTGSEIYYTTDGSEPTRDSAKGSTVLVDGAYGEAFVIRAIAATVNTVTAPYVFSYPVVARTPTPSASIPNGAVILKGASVTLTAPEGAIYYTTDGSEPASSGQIYTEPIALTGSTVLKIVAVADGKADSLTAEYIYTMAGQVAAPTASLPSGTIEVGSKITLSTTTEGAVIYYTTNGVDPTNDNLRDCFTYEGPVTISRPVSIRMFAVKQGMNASVVNAVTYTVAYPIEEEKEEQDVSTMQWNADRLFLFDQFVDSGEGPLFTDIVLRDSVTLAVLSAAEDALPENVRLVVERERSPSFEDDEAVTRALEMKLGALYSISLVGQNGEAVQPFTSDGVEIGVPIPEGYEDTVVLICRINENGTVTAFPTRRSAGMLYAVVDHFSKYAVAVPPPLETKNPAAQSWYLWLLLAGIFVAGAAALAVATARKRKKAKASE